jgi:hypothetical protein
MFFFQPFIFPLFNTVLKLFFDFFAEMYLWFFSRPCFMILMISHFIAYQLIKKILDGIIKFVRYNFLFVVYHNDEFLDFTGF